MRAGRWIICALVCLWALPAMAKAPKAAKSPKATKATATKQAARKVPVYDIAKIKAGCLKIGKTARWDEKTQRCELVAKPGLPASTLVMIGVLSGAALAGAAVAVTMAVINAQRQDQFVISSSGNASLW